MPHARVSMGPPFRPQGTIKLLQSNLTSTRNVSHHLLAEMGVVAGHLSKMGWDIHLVDPGEAWAVAVMVAVMGRGPWHRWRGT